MDRAASSSNEPRIGSFLRWFGRTYIKLSGWTLDPAVPTVKKGVLVAAPHTSNWDLSFMLAAAWALGIRVSWAGKSDLFRFPFGGVMRRLGGIAIDRSKRGNQVQALADLLIHADNLYLAIPPSGTRKKVEFWKSGFYHVARTANVPILLAFLDYGKKHLGIGPALEPSGEIRADMDKVRAFYDGMQGKYKDREIVPRLKEEQSGA